MSTTPPCSRRTERREVVGELARALREYQSALDGFDEAISEFLGVNRTDLRCLDLISLYQYSLRESLTAGALAKAAGVTTGAITFALDRLERSGFVRRRRDLADRRRVLVEMIPAAQEFAWKLHEPFVKEMRARTRSFDEKDLAAIEEFLHIGRELYEKHARLLRVRHGRERRTFFSDAHRSSHDRSRP